MPGYQLVERAILAPGKLDGIPALPNDIGLLDFLRELAADEFPFPQFHELRVVGLEEVLYAARPDNATLAFDIQRCLREAASDLQRRLLSVQVVFYGTLIYGATLWVARPQSITEYPGFASSPSRERDAVSMGCLTQASYHKCRSGDKSSDRRTHFPTYDSRRLCGRRKGVNHCCPQAYRAYLHMRQE